ncbi:MULTISPECIES: aldehyde ferredoxin oxidoreductase family protein [unclassified Pseudodesulfovibrio]|uniref:aldehyde ferredoxin oxidoreductase family protein n=1 Tax=unclassified Pseudodesulfovibrio TaxID=2661612 RepID=UPI000FEBF50A|nr:MULTISPECIES: aldehyde ferredoxin oxidoreductase family protein [unclassified Pseudodesulfovibrio]MCJ2165063.1 aldehyde ferredoxin oxidoreductase family protein [Pseudodesulfovibrio sp. S3-i]RWU03496.1 aldehyde ferredoxin oxidoreductase [Pseudodesulfovibrio sp. S3]
MYLYAGKILRVDLSAGTITDEPLNRDWLRQFWGGWGLAAKYFTELANPAVDALDASTPMIFMTGALAGTLAPLSGRFCMVSRSPQTGTIFESNVGGSIGPELKHAGYDGMIITGRAAGPVFISINDADVSIEDAGYLWGKPIFETEKALKAASGCPAAKSMAIGPAGENLIPFACVGSEAYRQFGRGGVGALFGSKNLKGVVIRGTGGIRVADMEKFLSVARTASAENLMTEANLWAKTDGTPLIVNVTNEMGLHPTRNFTYGVNEDFGAIGTESVKKATISQRACISCPLGCGKFTSVDGVAVEGPEYETLCLGGSNCGMNDLGSIIKFNRTCDDWGVDTITTGATIAMAMDMKEMGLHDFGLEFGGKAEYLSVVEEIATLSTDRGRDLALGTRGLGEKYNAGHLAVNSKGLEFPAYDPRGNHGMGLAYATSERGACHLRAFPLFSETPFDHEALVAEVVSGQNFNGIKWSMCICDFWGSVNSTILADLLSAALGETVTSEELDLAGERIWNLARLFNLKAGFTAKDDTLPDKILKTALKKGPNDGSTMTSADLADMKQRYYTSREWDSNGVPTQAKRAALSL